MNEPGLATRRPKNDSYRHLLTNSLTVSPNPTMQTVAQAATPIRGTTPRKRPLTPDVLMICLKVEEMVRFIGRVGSFFHGLHFHAEHLAGSANRTKLATP